VADGGANCTEDPTAAYRVFLADELSPGRNELGAGEILSQVATVVILRRFGDR
jgi:hypothetical protein